jgi:hypothetical protein
MSEKANNDDFDDDEDEDVGESDAQLSHLLRDFDQKKRKPGAKVPEPAWRRLEKYREQIETAELISDFEDYDLGDGELRASSKPPTSKIRKKNKPRD